MTRHPCAPLWPLRRSIRHRLSVTSDRRKNCSTRELRAELISTQVIGLIQSWAIVEEPRLTGADMGSIVRLYGAAIQVLVEGE